MKGPTQPPRPEWAPFRVLAEGEKPLPPRSIHTLEGMGDRMRVAAFAELQAREAFAWAAEAYPDASESLQKAWKGLSLAEDRHLVWILNRMEALGIDIQERAVSDQLWDSLVSCPSAKDFAVFMANAEERGRKAGERFYQAMENKDPETANIFKKIAEEEIAHIEVTRKHYPETSLNPEGSRA